METTKPLTIANIKPKEEKEVLYAYLWRAGIHLKYYEKVIASKASQLGMDYKILEETSDDKPLMFQLMDQIEKGIVKNLFIYNLSRIAKKPYYVADSKKALKEFGIRFSDAFDSISYKEI